jgi:hypothetical protein
MFEWLSDDQKTYMWFTMKYSEILGYAGKYNRVPACIQLFKNNTIELGLLNHLFE